MFQDRVEAGRRLAAKLAGYADRDDVLVLAIPRGGVAVAFEVAQALRAPLDILLVRKLGAPGQRELAMGAIASGGVRVLNRQVVDELGITEKQLAETVAVQEAELERRERLYRGARPGVSVQGKVVILVDDGIATGSSMLAAIDALRTLHPKKIVVAVPVASFHADQEMNRAADDFVSVLRPESFFAIGEFYGNFAQMEDSEVQALLERAAQSLAVARQQQKKGVA
ncbi:MAG TPA: phosphoribosyltransferase [Candidatus Angelobacter sp.]|nr:phosphoribosyltransferase [Candidatus Angelobacter sp.]